MDNGEYVPDIDIAGRDDSAFILIVVALFSLIIYFVSRLIH